VNRFEDLRVWQAAKQQCDQVGALLQRPAFRRDLALSDQMNRAALSVLFNISEGFLRRRDKETKQFLRYAIAYLMAVQTAPYIERNEHIAKMLRRWYSTLGGTDVELIRFRGHLRKRRMRQGVHDGSTSTTAIQPGVQGRSGPVSGSE